ncbi:MAG: hypothetical protein RLZZ568_445, partial [Cyanobacteriota bacterium]
MKVNDLTNSKQRSKSMVSKELLDELL